jgi:hypothetical protein
MIGWKGRFDMNLDKSFQFAVILGWDELMKTNVPGLVRVEYKCEPGTFLDYASVWLVRDGGYQNLICDFWTWTSPAHSSGMRFRGRYYSQQLTEALEFIMKNQDRFTRSADACRDGLVLIYPPTETERSEAVTWMGTVRGTARSPAPAAA